MVMSCRALYTTGVCNGWYNGVGVIKACLQSESQSGIGCYRRVGVIDKCFMQLQSAVGVTVRCV